MTRLVEFSLKRCWLLIRNDIFINRSRLLATSLALWVLLIFISIWNELDPNTSMFYSKYYFGIFFLSGLAIYGGIFKELHHEVKGAAWLTTPASILEKLVSRILLGTVILAAGIMVLVFLSSMTSEWIKFLLFGSYRHIFNPFSEGIFKNTIRLFIILSPFFLGAIYFKKSSLVKTFLILGLYLALIVFTVLYPLKVIYGLPLEDLLFGINPEGEFMPPIFQMNSLEPVWSVAKWIVKFGFWWVLAPLCWVTAYIRLKETEV